LAFSSMSAAASIATHRSTVSIVTPAYGASVAGETSTSVQDSTSAVEPRRSARCAL
jgi:hypothetical protein